MGVPGSSVRHSHGPPPPLQLGLVDRFLAPEADEVNLDHGLFGAYLDSSIEKNWGIYTLTIKRGETFPNTMSEFLAIAKTSDKLDDAAAVGALARGETLYVQMLDDKDAILYQKGISLKPLLLKSDTKIDVVIPGFRKAKNLYLALTPRPMTK